MEKHSRSEGVMVHPQSELMSDVSVEGRERTAPLFGRVFWPTSKCPVHVLKSVWDPESSDPLLLQTAIIHKSYANTVLRYTSAANQIDLHHRCLYLSPLHTSSQQSSVPSLTNGSTMFNSNFCMVEFQACFMKSMVFLAGKYLNFCESEIYSCATLTLSFLFFFFAG